ncbi:MAG: TIGR02757 family protein [Deltaproteobacteria bacterium]|nr:MAG: TIGR02757 family protein [Deltaproteobacteria bacterium]
MGPALEALLTCHEPERYRSRDPVAFVHRYRDPRDQELVGLVASSLAYGRVQSIQDSVARVLARLGPQPSQVAHAVTEETFRGIQHRWTTPADLAALVYGAGVVASAWGSLGAAFAAFFDRHRRLRAALGDFARALYAVDFRPVWGRRAPPPGLRYLLPDAQGPGAAKRLNMYLRWMVRRPDGVDLGLWPLPGPEALVVPLDTHTVRFWRYLGLTTRRQPSWAAAEEITWHLAALCPEDPVRYDFALAHLGISGRCRHRRIPSVCGACPLGAVCRL